jgi:hypothetical protein
MPDQRDLPATPQHITRSTVYPGVTCGALAHFRAKLPAALRKRLLFVWRIFPKPLHFLPILTACNAAVLVL